MKNILLIVAIIFISPRAISQQIVYSEPENNDIKTLNFEIIGKIQEHYLVYKNTRGNSTVSVYDAGMKLVDKTDLKFMPDRTLNVDFVPYPDFAWMIYQHQHKGVVYCMAAKIDANGKLLTDPIQVDTTAISFFADNKIYSTIRSEDKSKIMVYKIQKKNDEFNFTTLLLNDTMGLLHKSRIQTNIEDRKNVFSDFYMTNSGNFVFARGNKSFSRDYIENLDLITKAPNEDSFTIMPIDLSGNLLDEVKLKVDNVNEHYLLNSLYYTKKRGNVEGLFTTVIGERDHHTESDLFHPFSDSLRAMAKNEGGSRTAFNDFFIRDINLKKDGGYVLSAEDYYSQSRGNPWNRYDYLYGSPYYSPYYYNYYSPFNYGYYGNRYNSNSQVRYFYNNILVLSLDSTGKFIWGNVVHKSQYDDESDNYLSYVLTLTGGELHFLFNELQRRNQFLNDQSVTGSGKVIRNPPLKSLDRGYTFMPRYGKQVSASETIIPCTYRNYICFAKIEY